MMRTIDQPSVHVVDDDDSFRISIARLLSGAGFNVVGYRCAIAFLIAQAGDVPGCMLLDISMPGPSGVDLLKALVNRESVLPVIFITGRDDVHTSVDVMKSGAFDYLVKPVSADRLLPTVRSAMQVDAQRRQEQRELRDLQNRFDSLTDSERAIFYGIMRSKLTKQLAAELGTCERTIKAHRARMMSKLELFTVPELVRAARLLDAGNMA
jgi:FixJ family two-component response regulator